MKTAIESKLDYGRWVDDPDRVPLERLIASLQGLDSEADTPDRWVDPLWQALIAAKAVSWSLPSHWSGESLGRSLLLTRYAEVAEGSLVAAFVLSQHDAGVRRLLAAEERPIAKEWLGRIVYGEAFVTVGISQLTTSRRHGAQALVATENPDGSYRLDGVMPWVTSACKAEVVIAGAVLEDGRQLLIALPMQNREGIKVEPAFRLAALESSMTAEITCRGVRIEASEILIGPLENVMAHPGAAGTGGLETSALALGQARAALKGLADELEARPELGESTLALAESWSIAWNDLMSASEQKADAPAPGKVRAEANALALKATQAYLTAKKGSGFVRDEPAQRWARQALFFLVWSCPSPVANAMIRDMAGVCEF